jgi:Ca2+-binding EF-hand superfamily protein
MYALLTPSPCLCILVVKVAAHNRNKGNAAFKAGEWEKAINYYSKSLKVDPTNFIVTSNRSSAYLKMGQKEDALKDAERCIQLSKTYAKGHARKAMALHAMKKYSEEVNAYKAGLKYCPDDKNLKEGMDKARLSRSSNSRASQAANKTKATMTAAKSRQKKAQKSSSVSQFVKETKKNLELQLAAIQAQLKMVSELATMGVEEKLDLLYTLMDKDKSGTIDAKELADALRKRNEGLTFGDAIQKSIEMIAIYDEDGDAELDRDEFRHFVERMVSELHATIDEFCEFLVYQLLFSLDDDDDNEAVDISQLKDQVRERGQLLDALSDPRMMSLFVLFDRDGDSAVSFKEVACGLYHLTKSMEESAKATTGLLLMMDKDDKRVLVYEQFAKLILAIAAAAHTTFDEVADDLTLAMTAEGADQMDPHVLKALTIADEEYAQARDAERAEKEQRKVHDALSYGRTLRLFDLWDVDGSGTIDFEVRAKTVFLTASIASVVV